MDCPLCNANNSESAAICTVCDTPLQQDLFAFPEQGRTSFRLKTKHILSLLAILLALATTPWLLSYKSLQTPLHVKNSRTAFFQAVHHFKENPKKWITKKDQILEELNQMQNPLAFPLTKNTFENIPFEVALAYFYDELDWELFASRKLSLYPIQDNQPGVRVILSKVDATAPFTDSCLFAKLSLEQVRGDLKVKVEELFRGEEPLDTALFAPLFSEELAALQKLEQFAEGFDNLQIQNDPEGMAHSPGSVLFSWKQLGSHVQGASPNA